MDYKKRQQIVYIMEVLDILFLVIFYFTGKTIFMALMMGLSLAILVWELYGCKCPHCRRRIKLRDREKAKCPRCGKELK